MNVARKKKPLLAKSDQIGPPLNLPAGESQEIEPGRLLLDPQNLRLMERVNEDIKKIDTKLIGQRSVQEKLYKLILEDRLFDIAPLKASIAYNGFLKHERLIVAKYDGDHFLVLEGNRRLTAVRALIAEHGSNLSNLPNAIRQSLQTLPCFVLEGNAIGGSSETLLSYRRASEIYIGMRHLMGAKSWEPASRYEFQARLISDKGWTPAQIAERFGREKTAVVRDLKAQKLYQDFRKFEEKSNVRHALTYNAFAEAARAPSIMKWLGWSNDRMTVSNKENEQSFFHYLTSRLKVRGSVASPEGEEEDAEQSAESIVRRLREMLKLDDDNIQSALIDREFDTADILFEERREGTFARRLASYTRGLKRVTSDELGRNIKENKAKLAELVEEANKIITLLTALTKR